MERAAGDEAPTGADGPETGAAAAEAEPSGEGHPSGRSGADTARSPDPGPDPASAWRGASPSRWSSPCSCPSSPAVVGSTRAILAAGFDGAHFDLEPLHSGDRHYLDLLDDLREVTRAHGVPLSVAAHQIGPLPAFHSVWGTLTGHPKWWSQAYFGQVARRVDQIAVMSYDTMQPLQSLYGGYVAEQTSLALEVTPPTTGLLMGLPFYHENRFGHRAAAETVPAAVRGVRLGLSRTDADRKAFGVALYVDFAATQDDWTAYREGWVHPS